MSKIYQYPLKIDKQIIDNIRTFAEQDGRSLNKEIEYILRQYAIDRGMYGEDSLGNKKKKWTLFRCLF